MIIYLVRHCLSAANITGLVTGTILDVLANDGVHQAILLSDWLKEVGIVPAAFYVSNWSRARQTADLLYGDVDWIEDERLGETNAGLVADLPLQSFLSSWPDFYLSPENYYPEGESHMLLSARVSSFWQDIYKLDVPSIMIVTHAGPISCILQAVLGIGMEMYPAFLPANGSVSVLETINDNSSSKKKYRLNGFSLGPVSNIAHKIVK